MSNEIWKDIEGFEGIYQVSNLGRVKSLERVVSNGAGHRFVKQRILLPHINNHGYSTVKFARKNNITVHRLVAAAFLPNPENKPCINHVNGVKTDNRLVNLEWCTHSENTAHALVNGLHKPVKGENHVRSKLTDTDVLEIRRHKKNGMRLKDVAGMFNISRQAAGDIVKNITWKHI